MRAPLHLFRTGCTAVIAGALTFVLAAGGASSAAELRDGSFADDLAFATPSGMSPAADTKLSMPSDPLTLAWEPVPGASTYEVQVALRPTAATSCSSSAAFATDDIKLTTSTAETGWVPDLLGESSGKDLSGGSYCWRVRADGDTKGPWSAPSSFSIDWSSQPTGLKFYNDTDGSIPRLPTDADYATGSAKGRDSGYLHWEPVLGAAAYDLQVSRSANFPDGGLALSAKNIQTHRISLPTMTDEDGYHWRVRTVSANGQRGAWSTPARFAIERYNETWTNSTGAYPAYDAAATDALVGWNPVAGASFYELQTASSANCFWDSSLGQSAPQAWEGLLGNSDCRLSDAGTEASTTINNWASADMVIGEDTRAAFEADCPGLPCARDLPLTANDPNNRVYWRVRPVWQANPENESFWKFDGTKKVYGAWLQNETAGYPRPNRFQLDRPTSYDVVSSPRCDDPANPTGDGCVRMYDGPMSIGNPATNSTSLQLPLLRWGAFPGAGQAAPGGYVVQIARDPFFNRILSENTTGLKSPFGVQQSFAPRWTLDEDDESDGYWWRVIPCQSDSGSDYCDRFYYEGASGISALARAGGFNDGAQPRSFSRSVQMSTASVDGFGGTTPLLLVAGKDASTPAQWAAGVQGAEAYQFQISRKPYFPSLSSDEDKISCTAPTDDVITLCSSSPRMHPTSVDEGRKPLGQGLWYWRARGIDRNGDGGSWSEVASFHSTLPAPTVSATSEKSGPGVVVRWNAVAAASSYEVEYSKDAGFADSTLASTAQMAFRIPSTTAGTVYWRVRGVIPGADSDAIKGTWSASTAVSVVPATKLRYGVAAATVKAGAKATIEGQLLVAGAPASGRSVQLQRKTVACNASGSYVALTKSNTSGGEGVAKLPAKVLQNACYRLAYVGDKVVYSAPFSVGATPVVKAKLVTKKVVKRKAKSCATMTSNRPLNGTITYQYRPNAKAAWAKAGTTRVKNFSKKRKLCFVLPKAGKFNVRASFSGLRHPKQGWTQYQPTTVSLGTMTVNNVWIVKSSKKKK